eukprot:14387716-Alexandrium_andersonii.AAC.1
MSASLVGSEMCIRDRHAAAAAVVCPAGWQCAFDVNHKVNYFYHTLTRESQWDLPAASPPPAP